MKFDSLVNEIEKSLEKIRNTDTRQNLSQILKQTNLLSNKALGFSNLLDNKLLNAVEKINKLEYSNDELKGGQLALLKNLLKIQMGDDIRENGPFDDPYLKFFLDNIKEYESNAKSIVKEINVSYIRNLIDKKNKIILRIKRDAKYFKNSIMNKSIGIKDDSIVDPETAMKKASAEEEIKSDGKIGGKISNLKYKFLDLQLVKLIGKGLKFGDKYLGKFLDFASENMPDKVVDFKNKVRDSEITRDLKYIKDNSGDLIINVKNEVYNNTIGIRRSKRAYNLERIKDDFIELSEVEEKLNNVVKNLNLFYKIFKSYKQRVSFYRKQMSTGNLVNPKSQQMKEIQ